MYQDVLNMTKGYQWVLKLWGMHFKEVVLVHNRRKRSHIFLTKMSRHILTLLEFTTTGPYLIEVKLFSQIFWKQKKFFRWNVLVLDTWTWGALHVNYYSSNKAWWWEILIWGSMCIHGHGLLCKVDWCNPTLLSWNLRTKCQ